MIAIKHWFISAILVTGCTLMVSVGLEVHAQESSPIRLSDEDKSAIVESVLQEELKAQGAEFKRFNVSSENIDFLEPSVISRLGLELISPASIRDRQIVEYVVFRSIEARGKDAMVTLSRVVEGHPCFGPAFSRQQTFTYQYQIEFGRWRWAGNLIRKTPGHPGRLPNNTRWSEATGLPLRIIAQ